ncbi:MAG TPA: hypothetical protein VGI71_10175 [Scandinavium sp.]
MTKMLLPGLYLSAIALFTVTDFRIDAVHRLHELIFFFSSLFPIDN